MRCLDTQQMPSGELLDVTFCWYPSNMLLEPEPEQQCETISVQHMNGQLVKFEVTCEGDICKPIDPDDLVDGGGDADVDAGR